MRILLVSTYELGHQPLHLASPAARLRGEGHEVQTVDLSLEGSAIKAGWPEAIAYSVPMHTALRLAIQSAIELRTLDPDLPIAFYGLYAGMGGEELEISQLVGEYETLLVEWSSGLTPRTHTDISQQKFLVPDRTGLSPLSSYAHLAGDVMERQVGYVEASHGCRHRCRHCPIPAVYDGRYRITGHGNVMADIDQQVLAGAEHITFGDPDFLNAPRYSMDVLRAAHRKYPDLTFDVTVKVSHILDHRHLWPELASLGVVMVVSAFETTNDRILKILDKGHSAAEMGAAVKVVRGAGIELRPSWLPFTPWTEPGDLAEILDFLDMHDLLDAVDPVQLSVRLLVPRGSLLADRPEMSAFDAARLSYTWFSPYPGVEEMQSQIARLAEDGIGRPHLETIERIWVSAMTRPFPSVLDRGRLRLSEPWFCCSEPTQHQLVSIRS